MGCPGPSVCLREKVGHVEGREGKKSSLLGWMRRIWLQFISEQGTGGNQEELASRGKHKGQIQTDKQRVAWKHRKRTAKCRLVCVTTF